MKSRQKFTLGAFLLITFWLGFAIHSPSAGTPHIVSISELQGNSCPTCGTGYAVNFCQANAFRLPAMPIAPDPAISH